MICSGEALADGGTTQTEVAIVGAGAIGVALAVRLAGRVGRIALIEAGGSRFKPAHQLSFFRAEQIDDPRHTPTELYRRRMLGGTTSVWGGRCIPFDPEDFASACGRPGWPITFAEFYCTYFRCTRVSRCRGARVFRSCRAAKAPPPVQASYQRSCS